MQSTSPSETSRPFSVSLVAGFQVFKAGFLLLYFAQSWRILLAFPKPGKIDDISLFRYVFILSLPVVAIYSLAIGYGLWRMRRWARQALMITIINCWMIGSVSFNGPLLGAGIFMDNWETEALIGALILDLLIYGCLAWYPGVADAFGESSS